LSEQTSLSANNRGTDRPWLWQPGQSGNPNGRPKAEADVGKLCRQYGQRAVEVLADLMEHEADARIRLAAANSLLDRGFGRPSQQVTVDGDSTTSSVLQHLLAARLVATIDASNAPPTLEAKVVADETTAPDTNVSTPPPNIFEPASE